MKNLKIIINNKSIKFEETVKYLGVLIDNKLTWRDHILFLSNIISKNIGILYRSSLVLDRKHLLLLYNSLILPHINYCCIVWGMTFPSLINKIEILQKKAVRIISGSSRIAHSEPLFKELKLLKVKDIAKQQALILIHRKIQHSLPGLVGCLFAINEYHTANTRNIKHITEPFSHKLYRTHTVGWQGPRLWNTILAPIFPLIRDIPISKNVIKKSQKLISYKRMHILINRRKE